MSLLPSPLLGPGVRIHFMGIGGIGMSGLAGICLEQGCIVSGCDTKLNSLAHRLQERGASISIGHSADHIDEDADILVYSSAVRSEEPELKAARSRSIRTLSRGELLAELCIGRRLIGIAGAHGKTTTSGMASQLLTTAGWDPTIVVGGMMLSLGTNAKHGNGRFLVAETDESDGSFLHLSPEVAIVTNIDREHLNHYHTFERLIASFQQYVRQLRPNGTLIYCYDDLIVRGALFHPSQVGYGFDPDADVTASRMIFSGQGSLFRASFKGRSLGCFSLQVPGKHNVLNALAVVSLGLTLDIPMVVVREALADFQGTGRRFQLTRLPADIWVVEDYAHHPSEIRATLAADTISCRHRVVVFQPHRFSRTQTLEREFSSCFDAADGVIVTDIYAAFEQPIPGVSGERLANLIRAHGHPCVRYIPKQNLTSYVTQIVRPGDTLFFLGAGDIGEMCSDVAKRLRAPARASS